MGIQKKFVQRIIASCFAFVIGISTLVAIVMNVNKSTALGGDGGTLNFLNPQIIACSSSYTMVIQDGKLFAWGKNLGTLGDGTSINRTIPVKIGTENNWISITAGTVHSLAINELGELYAWGNNSSGQLGDGTTVSKITPVQIGTENNWVSISAGNSHSLAINSLGELYAWGNNSSGQLGDGTNVDKNIPVKISNQTNWVRIAAGNSHSLAINSLGELYAWGHNGSGQIGDGTYGVNNNKNTPVKVGNQTNWVSISAGNSHSLAINSLGELYAWGANNDGQLGDGTFTYYRTPVKIGNETNWVSISGGTRHSLAINELGELYAWGLNDNGQLGDGTTTARISPVKIGTETNWVSIAAGFYHSLAINSLGETLAWGLNDNSQLGLGDTVDRNEPTLVGYNVAAPNNGTGYTVSAPSATRVKIDGSYTFTITLDINYTAPIVTIKNTNGKVNISSIDNNVYTYTISNVVGNIVATDFTVSVSRIL